MDIDDLDAGRLLNVVYARIIDDYGPLVDRAEVITYLDKVLSTPPKSKKGARRTSGLTVAQAAKMAADLLDYDAKAAKGKVSG